MSTSPPSSRRIGLSCGCARFPRRTRAFATPRPGAARRPRPPRTTHRGPTPRRSASPSRVPHPGQSDAAAEGVAPRRRGHLARPPGPRAARARRPTASPRGRRRGSTTSRRAGRRARTLLDRRAAEEVDVGAQLAGEQQPGLDGTDVGRELTAEGAVALVQPQRLDRVVAAAVHVEVGAGREQVVVDTDGELGRHVQLPAELADVGDPGGAHGGVAERDHLRGRERERLVGQVRVGVSRESSVARRRAPSPRRRRATDVTSTSVDLARPAAGAGGCGPGRARWSRRWRRSRYSSSPVRVTVTSDS